MEDPSGSAILGRAAGRPGLIGIQQPNDKDGKGTCRESVKRQIGREKFFRNSCIC
jgi:hypothetical protein